MRCDELVGDLFPHLSALHRERVFFDCGVIRLMASTREAEVACPGCAVTSNRVHGTYGRRLADTPVGDRPVLVELTVRRLCCENIRCPRRTFAEQVEGLTVRYGRRTPAARRILEAVAVALAGRAGSRLAAVLHAPVSRTTLLRAVMAMPDPAWTVPKVLGVDDFATRRGQHYGTVLIDCETSAPAQPARPLQSSPGQTLGGRDRHVRAFAEILTTRSGQHLKDWIAATRTEDLPGLHTFTHGLEKDWDAVVQGLTTCWNSGPVEGRVNHIKMIRRQMFGRAKLPLLRKRVLLTAAGNRRTPQP
ncbi:transposase family protein [Streptomyces sp. NBC_01764]|nr:transposase family protein [Streptomyces sp. NBC_01764]